MIPHTQQSTCPAWRSWDLVLTSYPVLKARVSTLYNDTKNGKGAQRLVRTLKTEEASFNNFILRLRNPPISLIQVVRISQLWKDRKLQGKLETRLGRVGWGF